MVEAYQLYLGSVVLLSVCCLCLTPDRFTTFVQSMKTLFGSFVIQCIYAGEFGRQRPTAASHEQEGAGRQTETRRQPDGSQTEPGAPDSHSVLKSAGRRPARF